MGDRTSIEWTEATWNPIRGCSIVSEGCRNCYAMRQAHRMDHPGGAYEGLTRQTPSGPKWTGSIRLVPELLDKPLRWKRPRRIFVNSMSDLFHEDVPDDFIDQVFAVMALAPQHVFQVLTKRPERMREYLTTTAQTFPDAGRRDDVALEAFTIAGQTDGSGLHRFTDEEAMIQSDRWPLPNCWLGTSVEDQALADTRIQHLLATPAAIRWLSCEPLLADLDIRRFLGGVDIVREHRSCGPVVARQRHGVDWVVVGGESGPGARPFDVAWARSIIDQCRASGVPVFVKQLGAQPVDSARSATFGPEGEVHYTQPAGHRREIEHRDAIARGAAVGYSIGPAPLRLRDRKGGDPERWPEDLRVREYPQTRSTKPC